LEAEFREQSLFMGRGGLVENGRNKHMSAHDFRGLILSARRLRGVEFQCMLQKST